jgi:hypothetical protein
MFVTMIMVITIVMFYVVCWTVVGFWKYYSWTSSFSFFDFYRTGSADLALKGGILSRVGVFRCQGAPSYREISPFFVFSP